MTQRAAKNVIVTGAARGMGAAAVAQLAGRGANVLAVDLDAEGLAGVATQLKDAPGQVETAVADVSDERAVGSYTDRAAGLWGGLDGIFQVAGMGGREFVPLAEVPTGSYDEIMRVNARSMFLGMKYALPHLVARGGGAIVNTGSHLAWHAAPTFAIYTASKHAVVGMTKAVALEYGALNVRANLICPSAMDTRMGEETATGIDPDNPEAGWEILRSQSSNGRVAQPGEAAAAGVWLLLDAPQHVSGIIIPVDGGQSAK
jgi:NAD(P)-dependent dehydrogenase (short-subunit alcohol dehydrogenase family)